MLGRRKPARAASAAIAKRRLAVLESSFPARPDRDTWTLERAARADDAADGAQGDGAVDGARVEAESVAPEPPARTRSRVGGRHAAYSLGPLRSLALTTQQVTLLALAVAAVIALAAWWVIRAAPHAEPVQLAQEQILPTSATDGSAVSDSPTASTVPTAATVLPSAGPLVVVDVAGKVRRPGIVELPAGSRVVDALRAVGGPRRGIDTSALNLARLLVDGEQIVVGVDVLATPFPAAPTGSTAGAITPVDVNTATVEQLDTLPGIGPVTAQAILDWRADNGAFTSVDELLEVSGIGDAILTVQPINCQACRDFRDGAGVVSAVRGGAMPWWLWAAIAVVAVVATLAVSWWRAPRTKRGPDEYPRTDFGASNEPVQRSDGLGRRN